MVAHVRKQLRPGVVVGDLMGQETGAATGVLNRFGAGGAFLLIAAGDDDLGAFARERCGGRAANVAATADHQSDTACDPSDHD